MPEPYDTDNRPRLQLDQAAAHALRGGVREYAGMQAQGLAAVEAVEIQSEGFKNVQHTGIVTHLAIAASECLMTAGLRNAM